MITVLYVDDEPDLLEVAKLFLERNQEFRVGTVTSAERALEILGKEHYDAVISDYQMPGMNGIELLKAVREQFGDLPFIIFTGRGREEVVIQALNEGVDFYLHKGGDAVSQFAELAHKVKQAVGQRRALTSIQEHERREADIINFLPDATFAIDHEGVVIAWNRAIEKLTGVKSEDIVGKGDYEYAIPFYDERRPILIDLVRQDDPLTAAKYPSIKREGTKLTSEIYLPQFNNSQGADFWFTASPLYDIQGNVVGAIESIREISDRKKVEDALN
ncbi:MAG TPA: response regulator, partial [Methanolinea sp.]|nr:response regulator [Methanolinea sp.]